MNDLIEKYRMELQKLSNSEGQLSAQKFHKELIKAYGIKVPIVRALAKQWFIEIKDSGKRSVFRVCMDLFESGYLEEGLIASDMLFFVKKQFQKDDFEQFQHWITHNIHAWSVCDSFCNNSVGAFLLMYPEYLPKLQNWAVANHRWLQRAAAVSLIVPARKGKFLKEIFEIADLELESSDDLVQKGYGWLLKVASKKFPDQVYTFVKQRKQIMPRTALRYAIEHFPAEMKAGLMKK